MSVREFKMELEVGYEVFFDKEAQNNYGFGIYSCKPVNYTREIVTDYQGKISIQGTSRRLVKGEKYDIKFNGTYTHAKHGVFYKIVEVAAPKLNTVDDQNRFLKAIITEAQLNSLKSAYPNTLLVDLILEEKIDTKKTKGIKAKSLAVITDKVKQNAHISVLIARLNELNLSVNSIDKLLKHFGSSQEVLDAIERNIYELCNIRTFGFKSVDSVALERGDEPTNMNRIVACIEYLLKKDNDEGHTWTERNKLVEDATELLYIEQELIIDGLNEMKKDGMLYYEGNRVANSRVREQEWEIYHHLKRIRDSYIAVENVEEKITERIGIVEKQQGFIFTDEQRNAITEGSKHGVIVLNGLAGAGKTGTVKGLIDSLGTDNYITCALSGKAVKVLSQRGIEASTIHRMLGYQNGRFMFNEDNQLPYGTIVADEMSMTDVRLLLSVLKAVPDGAKLILVGDSGQLPAIGYGDVLRDLLSTKAFPTYELTKVHRQAAKSGILSLANSIREGNQVMPYNSSGKEVYGELQDQTVISYSNKDSIPSDIIKIATSYKANIKVPEDLNNFQVIVANRERGSLSTRNMNTELQKVFNNMKKPFLNRNGYDFREEDKIIAQGNSYEQRVYRSSDDYYNHQSIVKEIGEDEAPEGNKEDIYNGTMGYIHTLLLEEKIVLIQFEGVNGLVAMSQSDLDKIDMAYSATCHKMQGSGIRNVVVALDYGAFKLLSKQWVYTALTRASGKGVMLVENNALHQAISNDESGNRRTFLADFMAPIE